MRILLALFLAGGAFAANSDPAGPAGGLTPDQVSTLRAVLTETADLVSSHYHPRARIDAAFRRRIDEAAQQLLHARSPADGFATIAEALRSLDERIEIQPPLHNVQLAYGWEWELVGDRALVTAVDEGSDADRQGLKIGDWIVSIQGTPVNRDTHQLVRYLIFRLSPSSSLRTEVRTIGRDRRELQLAAESLPSATNRGRAVSLRKHLSLATHATGSAATARVHHVGNVLYWRMNNLEFGPSVIPSAFTAAADASVLLLDLRGADFAGSPTLEKVLGGLFPAGTVIATVEQRGFDETIRATGSAAAFTGAVLVLVDAQTAGFAEVLARAIQQHGRGMVLGDRTQGRVSRDRHPDLSTRKLASADPFAVMDLHRVPTIAQASLGRQTAPLSLADISIPAGDIVMSDGLQLNGRGVEPDQLILPQVADLAARRDVVLATALAMAQQQVTPEEAYRLFRSLPENP